MEWFSATALVELLEVVLVNLVLSADNAIVVGIAVAGLPASRRWQVMVLGIAAATGLRIVFAAFTVQLLAVIGLLLAGGLLLLWICWKLWRELRGGRMSLAAATGEAPKSMRDAIVQIVVADVSMSLDNVLAVAGVARSHLWVLVVGLALSIAFMGLAAAVIARLLNRHPWIAYVGLAVILYVAVRMVWDGGVEVLSAAA
ncbi:MAG TPA: YjbE family putative metal transport protein [Gammaproteobacteria bacterium]|nr:YjbE family putative metal transport protein [Gammaproteobacteria bacterium]